MGLLDYEDRYGNGVSTEQAVQAVKDAIANGSIQVSGGGISTADIEAAVAAAVPGAVAAALPTGGMNYLGDYIGQSCTSGDVVRSGGHTYACKRGVTTPEASGKQIALQLVHTTDGGETLPLDPAAVEGDYLVFAAVGLDGDGPHFTNFNDWNAGPMAYDSSGHKGRMFARRIEASMRAAGSVTLPANPVMGTMRTLRIGTAGGGLYMQFSDNAMTANSGTYNAAAGPLVAYYMLLGNVTVTDPAAEQVIVQDAPNVRLTTLLKHSLTGMRGVTMTGNLQGGARAADVVGMDFPAASFDQLS